jgi:hypothetical protein
MGFAQGLETCSLSPKMFSQELCKRCAKSGVWYSISLCGACGKEVLVGVEGGIGVADGARTHNLLIHSYFPVCAVLSCVEYTSFLVQLIAPEWHNRKATCQAIYAYLLIGGNPCPNTVRWFERCLVDYDVWGKINYERSCYGDKSYKRYRLATNALTFASDGSMLWASGRGQDITASYLERLNVPWVLHFPYIVSYLQRRNWQYLLSYFPPCSPIPRSKKAKRPRKSGRMLLSALSTHLWYWRVL